MGLLLITIGVGIGVFIGMVLFAALSSGRAGETSRIVRVFPDKACYQCRRVQEGADEAADPAGLSAPPDQLGIRD